MSLRCPSNELPLHLEISPASSDSWQTRLMAQLNGKPISASEVMALALLNYGHYTSMRVEHRRFDDALFHNNSHFVSEGATWDTGFFDGNAVIWPDGDILQGITMKLLQQVHEVTIVASVDIRNVGTSMKAAFATNVTVGVRPISRINDIEFPTDHSIFSGVSPYGVYDMCGNTWEWLSTETSPGRYQLKGGALTSPFSRCIPATWNDASFGHA